MPHLARTCMPRRNKVKMADRFQQSLFVFASETAGLINASAHLHAVCRWLLCSALTILVSDYRWKQPLFSSPSVPATATVAALVAGFTLK